MSEDDKATHGSGSAVVTNNEDKDVDAKRTWKLKGFIVIVLIVLVGVGIGVGVLINKGSPTGQPTQPVWNQIGQDIDGEDGGNVQIGLYFPGGAIALSGDGSIVAVGNRFTSCDNPYSCDAGQVRVHQRVDDNNSSSSAWQQMGSDINGEAPGEASGSSLALSGNGTILAVGAPSTINYSNRGNGTVRVYSWIASSNAWQQMGSKLTVDTEHEEFGTSVALSDDGTILAVGAESIYANSPAHYGKSDGHVRVYEWSDNAWQQMGSDIVGEAGGDFSGTYIALSNDGSILAIGATGNDGNGSRAGHARVYKWSGNAWQQMGLDIDGEATLDRSGHVALSGDGTTLAVGAPKNYGKFNHAGHVRVYEWSGSSWQQMGSDIDGENSDNGWPSKFGESCALSDDGSVLAVGSVSNGSRVYKWNGSTWTLLGSDMPGRAVALSADGSIFAMAATLDGGDGSGPGYVRVYENNTAF